MKNYELLGLDQVIDPERNFDIELKELADERVQKLGCPNVKYRRRHIVILLTYPCWNHMGLVEFRAVTLELEEGLMLVADYFHGDWWTVDNIRCVERESPELLRLRRSNTVEKIIMVNTREMDRSQPDCEFEWHDELRSGIIFGGLLERWDEVAHLCSALDADVPLEYSAGTIVDEYFQFYLCVAGKLSGQWTGGMEVLLADAKKCRQKRLRDMIAAWEAAVAGDQAAFDKAFTAALKSFVKRKDDPSEYLGVALDETVIWLIAKKNGLRFPNMPDKLKAAVMTRESLKLDSTP